MFKGVGTQEILAGVMQSFWDYSAMSGGVLGCHNLGGCYWHLVWVEARDAVTHPTVHRTTPSPKQQYYQGWETCPVGDWPQRALKEAIRQRVCCSEASWTEVEGTGLGLKFSVHL